MSLWTLCYHCCPNLQVLCFMLLSRCLCDEITDVGLLRMLLIVKKDLRPPRHQAIDTDDDEDEEVLFGIEDSEETNEPEVVESEDNDDPVDDSEAMTRVEPIKDDNDKAEPSASDAYDSDMDDDAMFLMDSYIAQLLKDRRNSAGNDTAQSQLTLFKLRVLSLLEVYLQRNPGSPQVLLVYSCLVQAFVNSHSSEGRKQLGERIGGILQRQIFKAKEHPKGNGIQISNLEILLEKSLRLASRTRIKAVSLLAENSAFWILKVIHSSNFSGSELERVFEISRLVFTDYFDNKKCRLKSGFIKEVFRRHPWVARQLFDLVLEKCGSARSEFRRVETLDLLDLALKLILSQESDTEKGVSSKSKFLKRHLSSFTELICQLLRKFPEKQSRRTEVRRFCCKILHAFSSHNLLKSFIKRLTPDVYSACESKLGNYFLPFKKLVQ
uniref:Myb-binding protein 1A-like protein n=1 Tax=Anthurium amnicola TaxID=1678845 RepID=A0A1D1Z044_9ARAE